MLIQVGTYTLLDTVWYKKANLKGIKYHCYYDYVTLGYKVEVKAIGETQHHFVLTKKIQYIIQQMGRHGILWGKHMSKSGHNDDYDAAKYMGSKFFNR